jgi:hypothetical protein
MFERTDGLLVRKQQALDPATQRRVISASILEKIGALCWRNVQYRFKDRLNALVWLVHGIGGAVILSDHAKAEEKIAAIILRPFTVQVKRHRGRRRVAVGVSKYRTAQQSLNPVTHGKRAWCTI